VRLRGEPVAPSAKEYALLRALIADASRVRTKQELLRDVWGFRSAGSNRRKAP
jgi:DNA-binding response OmpR family regulator